MGPAAKGLPEGREACVGFGTGWLRMATDTPSDGVSVAMEKALIEGCCCLSLPLLQLLLLSLPLPPLSPLLLLPLPLTNAILSCHYSRHRWHS